MYLLRPIVATKKTDIIYQLHGGYRKDKTLTSLLQSSNSFVFITSLSPDHFAWMFYLLGWSSLKKITIMLSSESKSAIQSGGDCIFS